MIYLDHSATSPMLRSTIDAMWPYLTEAFANSSSPHTAGQTARAALDAARTITADILGVEPNNVIFTGGGTESINLALKGLALANPKSRQVVTTSIEHEAVLETCKFLAGFHDFRITQVPVDSKGLVDLNALGNAVSPGTTLCSVQYANSEVGTVQNIEAVVEVCHALGVPVHVDAVQAAGLLTCDLDVLDVDMLSISAHKFGGPKGVGALAKKSEVLLEPLVHGGGQEFGLRSGTNNVAGAVGLATALHTADSNRAQATTALGALRDQLIDGVLRHTPKAVLTGHETQRLPNHASFIFPGVSGESLVLDLDADGIVCSSGSACSIDSQEPSHVLLAMGFSPDEALSAVRFSLGAENTSAEIDEVINFFQRRTH